MGTQQDARLPLIANIINNLSSSIENSATQDIRDHRIQSVAWFHNYYLGIINNNKQVTGLEQQ